MTAPARTASTAGPATTGSRASRAATRSRARTATTSCPEAREPTRWPAAPGPTGCPAAPAPDRLSDVAGTYATVGAASKRNRVAAGAGRDRVDTANGRRDLVHCGSGRDIAIADREDTLAGCEDKRFRRSPLPEAAPPSGGRQQMFMVRFRALEEVASQGEQFSIAVIGPAGCGQIVTSSLGIRYRAGETVRYRLNPFGPDGRGAKRWCRGLYRGTVDFIHEPAPPLRIGRFSFRVR